MKYTKNLKLKKPDQGDFYNVDDFNSNADEIDSAIKKNQDGIAKNTADIATNKANIAKNTEAINSAKVDLNSKIDATKQQLNESIADSESKCVHLTGDEIIAGTKTFNDEIVLANGGRILDWTAGGQYKELCIKTDPAGNGGVLAMRTADSPLEASTFLLRAGGDGSPNLYGRSDGALFWDSKNIVRSVNGAHADLNGNVTVGAIPVGIVVYFTKNAVPSDYLVCNGAAVSRTTYAALFAVIGTTFGAGNGSTTFNLPNLIDRFPQGGTSVGSVKAAGLPDITGSIPLEAGRTEPTGAFCFHVKNNYVPGTIQDGGNTDYQVFFEASRSNAIYGKSNTVQPPALVLLPMIKY